jgi:hypothetical protein
MWCYGKFDDEEPVVKSETEDDNCVFWALGRMIYAAVQRLATKTSIGSG